MSSPTKTDKKPIKSKQELVDWFAQGNTPADKLLIGVEHEKPPFYLDNGEPVPFETQVSAKILLESAGVEGANPQASFPLDKDGKRLPKKKVTEFVQQHIRDVQAGKHDAPGAGGDDDEEKVIVGDDKASRRGIKDFIGKMIAENGWQPGNVENGTIIDIHKNSLSWTFEPGLQMETGGAPLKNVHQNAQETDDTINEAVAMADKLGFGLLAQGYHPTHTAADMPFMPKSRYKALKDWFAERKFPNAQDVASCTATVQVNLGYTSEEDMVKMLRVSLSLQPVAVALFANSPFSEGKLTGHQSYRSHKLRNNMGGRYGFMLPVAFEEGFGFEKFTDYALSTMPMLGIYKGEVFMDAKGAKFEDFMKGELAISPGQKATISDWQNHLNTIWPEVRVRRFLEMRGTDNGPQEMIKALPAFWVGLLYDKQSLNEAYEMIKDWNNQDRDYLRVMTPTHGLQTPFMGTTVQEIAKNCLALSAAGLKRRAIKNAKGEDERIYLDPLHEIAESGLNWAQRLEARFRNEWNGDISYLFSEMNYAENPSVLKPAPQHTAKRIILPGSPDFKIGGDRK